jgi:hypothetical protein
MRPANNAEYLAELRAARERLLVARQRLARSAPVRRYAEDPVAFARECIIWPEGEGLADYQEEVLANLATYRRECVRGPHGLGKTAVAAILVHWFALTRDGEDWKVLTTASAWRQLTAYLWPEINKWGRRLRWEIIGREPYRAAEEQLARSLKLASGQATALASDRPEALEGAHADQILYILDEAKSIAPATFDAIEGAFASGSCYALAISTPGEPAGRFYEIQAHRAGTEDWHVTHVGLERAIAAGRVSREWAAQRARQWGEGSAVYSNRVLGEFAASARDGVIPLAWVEAANERWLTFQESGEEAPSFTCVGVDVARSGSDKSIYALRHEGVIAELREGAEGDTMAVAGQVAGILRAKGGYAAVDVIGIGAGVVDRLRERGFEVLAFNASEATPLLDSSGELGFANCRSAAWWHMRELLDPANGCQIALPPIDELIGDLSAPSYRETSRGRIQVESKEQIRKRLGRSTDYAGAVIQAFWEPPVVTEYIVYYDDPVQISPF